MTHPVRRFARVANWTCGPMCGCMAVCRVTMTNMQSGHEWNGLPGVGSLQSGRLSLKFELHRIQSLVLMSVLWVVIIVHTHRSAPIWLSGRLVIQREDTYTHPVAPHSCGCSDTTRGIFVFVVIIAASLRRRTVEENVRGGGGPL